MFRKLLRTRGFTISAVLLLVPLGCFLLSESRHDGTLATVKGRVVYEADEPPTVKVRVPAKDAELCPPEVPGEGWYVDKKTKGVRYALVIVKFSEGTALERPLNRRQKPTQVILMPRGQFEPRVICLQPEQKLTVTNDGLFPIDLTANNVRNYFATTMFAGRSREFDIKPSDNEPVKLSCAQHTFMSAYVWKTTHPYAAVSDSQGQFEIVGLPVPGHGEATLWVWHEMLPGQRFKQVGPIELRPGKTVTRNLTLPEARERR